MMAEKAEGVKKEDVIIIPSPRFKVGGVLHGLCNAHHLRELEALAKIDGEAWARRMQQLLRRANRAVEEQPG